MLRFVLAVTVVVSSCLFSFAEPPQPQQATPSVVSSSSGGEVTLSGTGFAPGARVALEQAGLAVVAEGQVPRRSEVAEIDGDWLYGAGSSFDPGLFIVDISDVTAPVIVGEAPLPDGYATALAVHGDLLVAYVNRSMLVFDVSERTAPALLSTFEWRGWDVSIELGPRWLVIQDSRQYQTALIDLIDPNAPRVTDLEFWAGASALDGDVLHVATVEHGFQSWGLDGGTHALIAELEDLFEVEGMSLYRDHLYLTMDPNGEQDDGLVVLDVSDPQAPAIVGSRLATLDRESRFVGNEDRAFLHDPGSASLAYWDLSDPAQPRLIDEVRMSGYRLLALGVDGTLARSLDWRGKIALVDADRALVRERDVLAWAGGEWLDVLAARGDALYVRQGAEMHVYDISDPTVAVDRGVFATDRYHTAVLSGDLMYLWSFVRAPALFDISDPFSPVLRSKLQWGPYAFTWNGTHAFSFLPGWMGGILIHDLSDNANPQHVGTVELDWNEFCFALTAHGDALYAAGYRGIMVVDISDPSDPEIVSTLPWSLRSGWLHIYENNLIFDDFYGTHVYDVSEPLVPTHVVTRPGFGAYEPIATEGQIVHFESSGEIVSLDMSDVRAPAVVSKVRTPGILRGVLADGAFMAGTFEQELVRIPRLPLLEDVAVPSAEQLDFVVPPGVEPGPYTISVANPDFEAGSAVNALEVTATCALGLALEPAVALGQGPVPVPFPWTVTPSGDPGFLEPGAVHDAWLTMPDLPEALRVEERSLLDRAETRIELRLALDGSSGVVTLSDHDMERARGLWASIAAAAQVPLARDAEGGYAELRLSLQRPPAERVPGHVMSFEDAVLRLEFRDGALVAASARANQPDLLLGIEGETAEGCPGAGEASVATRIAELCAELAGTHPEWVLDCPTAPAGAGFAARGRRGR